MKEELLLQNPWWGSKSRILADEKVANAERADPKITYKFTSKNTIFLGPRQVGKTTYLKLYIKHLIEDGKNERDLIYFSCEPLSTKKDLIELFKQIDELSISEEKKYIFLDEVTSVEDWEQAVKYLLEQDIFKSFQLICTGSNAHLLKKGAERFPGRNIKIELFLPMTFSEYISQLTEIKFSPVEFDPKKIYENCKRLFPKLRQANKYLYNYLRTGGLPKPIYMEKIDSETYEIYTRWILGSLARLNKKESIFRPLVKGIISSYTSQVSLNSLAKDFQIPTHSTVETYLEVLNQLMLINILYKIDPKTKTPVFRKNKKIYFQDPFFYSVFKGFTFGEYKDYSKDDDKIIEGLVCQELASLKRTNPEISNILWYFDSKKETDFVLNHKELIGIEVKWSSKPKDFHNRYVFRERIILSKDKLQYDKEKKIYTFPLSLFLLSIRSVSSVYSK